MHKPFRDEIILGSLEDFRALMHELYILQEPQIKQDIVYLQGENKNSEYPKNMSRWEVTLGGTLQQRGYIMARQLSNGFTKIQFAYHMKFEPIGPRFEEDFIEKVLNQCIIMPSRDVEESMTIGMAQYKLLQKLAKHFSVEELLEIAFEMGIPHENFSSRLNAFAREFLEHCIRHQLIEKLLEICQRKRPGVSWQ